MNKLDTIVSEISLIFKKMGFRKNRLTWYKTNDSITIIFSIQKSQYDKDAWFYLFGICIHEIADGNIRSINSCQIKYRIDNVLLSAESISSLLGSWESMYGTLYLLKCCAIRGKLPGQCTVKAMRYLTCVNLTNI